MPCSFSSESGSQNLSLGSLSYQAGLQCSSRKQGQLSLSNGALSKGIAKPKVLLKRPDIPDRGVRREEEEA